MGFHCLKKHVLSTNFHWRQKRGVNNFLIVKEYGRHEVSSIQVLIYVSVFFTSIFLFQNAFHYFISKVFFNRSLPNQKYFSDGKFSTKTVYLPKECLLNKQSVSLCEVSKTLRIFKKPCFLNCMSFLHNYTQKSNILIKISPMAIAFYYFHIFIIFQLLLGINSTQRVIGCQNRIIKGQAKMN